MEKVAIGVPFYGSVPNEWWVNLVEHASIWGKQIDYKGIHAVGTMTADNSRNLIVKHFLETDADWLFWIDSDTIVPIGSLPRLLAVGKTMVSGLYYGKNPPHPPIAYHIYNGAYTPIDNSLKWEKGEILPVDMTGFGCMLTHRSVYEDIMKNYTVLQQKDSGGLYPIHNSDLNGAMADSHEHDGKVWRGQLRMRLVEPTLSGWNFPFFQIEHNRTEDVFFCNMARRVGHKPWLDSSIECGHLRYVPFTGEDYRNIKGH